MDEMFKYLYKYCKWAQQVYTLRTFVMNEDFDTDSIKLDTENIEKSNLPRTVSDSDVLTTMNRFWEAESGI